MKNTQPSSKNCFVCGIANPCGLHLKFIEDVPGEVTCDFIVPENFEGYPGIVHGGVVSAILDEVSGRSVMGDPDDPRFMFTAKMEVRFHKNIPVGCPLHAVGKMGKSKKRVATVTGGIYDMDGTLLAECESLLVDIPAEMIEGVDMEALGWKVYTDEEIAMELSNSSVKYSNHHE
ncbi:MAG: PaaI family thioesterase [Anaerolineales bacterium]|nr:PaaI family thioesterase [Anaerolineales bacterium]